MKKIAIILLIGMISTNLFAQKIKIDKKKGLMFIDKVEAARFSSAKNYMKKDIYTYTDLKSDDWVSLEIVQLDAESEYFLEVTSSLSDKKSEMKYEFLNFTFSTANAISNLIVKKYKFFSIEGINADNIINYIAQEDSTQKKIYARKKEIESALNDKINAFAPTFKDTYTLINKNTGELLALFIQPNKDKYSISENINGLIIKDQQGNQLGIIRQEEKPDSFPYKKYIYVLYTYDNHVFYLVGSSQYDIMYDAVKKLIINDYFGNGSRSIIVQKRLAEQEAQKEAEKKAQREAQREAISKEILKRSIVDGILTLKNNEIKEGTFKVEFRQTKEGYIGTSNNLMINLDGKEVYYYYKDEKGKDKVKIYTEKDIQSFEVINKENSEDNELYVNLTYIEEANDDKSIVTDGALDGIKVGKLPLKTNAKDKTKKSIAYLASDMPKTTLYFFNNNIFITDKISGKTIILNHDNFKSQLKNIAQNCNSVIQNVENNTYEYSRRSIYYFTQDLEKCD